MNPRTYDAVRISRAELAFRERDKISGQSVLGTVFVLNNSLILEASISTASFLKYSFEYVNEYLGLRAFRSTAFDSFRESNIEICLIDARNGVMNVILKTFWLKMLQLKWRKKLQIRKKDLDWRKNNILLVLRNTEMYGTPY
jgi:hypothetical protein